MNFGRRGAGILVTVLAVFAFLFWTVSSQPVSETPSRPELPIVQVEMKADLDQFIQLFPAEPLPSLGLVEAEAFERELILGWDNRWLSLPRIYRREVVEKIGRPLGDLHGCGDHDLLRAGRHRNRPLHCRRRYGAFGELRGRGAEIRGPKSGSASG